MYDVVKNDPGYAKHSYKGNANAIRDMLIVDGVGQGDGGEYRNYNDDEGDNSDASSVEE